MSLPIVYYTHHGLEQSSVVLILGTNRPEQRKTLILNAIKEAGENFKIIEVTDDQIEADIMKEGKRVHEDGMIDMFEHVYEKFMLNLFK